jgi:transcriptional repressor NrdR
MKCPVCEGSTRVIDSRLIGRKVKRRRECPKCKTRFNTFEKVDLSSISLLYICSKIKGFTANE